MKNNQLHLTYRMAKFLSPGFTLIELLVVIAIIGLLSTLAIVALGTARAKSRDARRLSDLKQIQTALEMYNNERGSYPATTSTILLGDANHACLGSNGFNPAGGCTNQYISFPKDPSGGNYVYYGSASYYAASGSLEGSVNDMSGAISVTPSGGVSNGSSVYGLVGWWKFDEGTGTTTMDSSGKRNNGNFDGLPVWQSGSACVAGGCLEFQGATSRVIVANTSSLSIPDNLTITAWIRVVSSDPNDYSFHPIAKTNSTATANYVWYYCGAACGARDNSFIWYANRGGTWAPVTASTSPISGNWNHIALTYSNGGQLYWNGQPVGGKIGSGNLGQNVANLSLGKDEVNNTSAHFLMDDIRIYNRALSATEIKNLYNNPQK